MSSCTIKLDEKNQNMPVWLEKIVLAQNNCMVCGGW